MKLKQKSKSLYAAWFCVIIVLTLIIAIPLLFVFFSAKISDYKYLITNGTWHKTILNTILECVCSSTLSVLVGFLYAYAIVKADFPGKRFFKLIPLIHLLTPPFVGGLAFILLLGRQGFITHKLLGLNVSIYGFWGLLIAQTLCFFPIAYLICLQSLVGINSNLEQSAKSMGASNLKIFWTVTVPLSSTGIYSSLLFIAVSVLSDFGNPLIVAGRFRVLAVEIYTQLTGWMNIGSSAVLGIILVIPSIIFFIFQTRLIKRNSEKLATIGGKSIETANTKNYCSKPVSIALFCFVIFISVAILAQFLAILAGSFQKLWGINTSFTLEHIKNVFKYGKELRNSLLFSLAAAFISTNFAIMSSYIVHRTDLPGKKYLDTIIQLPSAIPGSLMGLSLSLAANKIHFKGSALLIIIAMTVAFLPFAYKTISSSFSQISINLEDGARSLGANQLKVLKTVFVPLASGGVFSAFIYAFIRGAGTLSSVIFLVSFKTSLTSVKILNLAEEGFWGKSCALALVLTLLTFTILGIGILILEILKKRNYGKRINSK